jgi:hypothetical protein
MRTAYFVRLLRMYSAAVVLSGKGFTGISLISLVAALSLLFMEGIPIDTRVCLCI